MKDDGQYQEPERNEALKQFRERLRDAVSSDSQPRSVFRNFLNEQAQRLASTSGLERVILAGTLALVVLGAFLGLASLSVGDDNKFVSQAGPGTTLAQNVMTNAPALEPTTGQPPEPSPTAAQEPTIDARVLTLPDRTECDSVRGTAYRSAAEREWFLANCQTQPTLEIELLQLRIPPMIPEGVVPSPAPPNSTGFTASDAITYGARWISIQANAGYELLPDSCSASQSESVWSVTCRRAGVLDCASTICRFWPSVCVAEPNGAILLEASC